MKRCVSLICCLLFAISLFAFPISAEAIPEDEIIQIKGGIPEQFVVPVYSDGGDDWYASYTVSADALVVDEVDFQLMMDFFAEFGDAYPEGFAWTLYVNGVAYKPVYFDYQTNEPVWGNLELKDGYEMRDIVNNSSVLNWDFDYEYDDTLHFYCKDGFFQVDETLADGFTCSLELVYTPKVEPVDYNDYVSNVALSPDSSVATVTFPADWAASHVRLSGDRRGEGIIYYGADFSHDFTGVTGTDNHIQMYPFGWFFPTEKYSYHGKALYAGNIPDGSTLSFTFTLRAKCTDSWLYEPEDTEFKFRVAHVAEPGVTAYIEDGTYKVLSMTQEDDEFVMKVKCSYTKSVLQNEAEYLAFCCGFDLAIAESESAVMDFSLDDVKLEISVSALVAQLMESQKTNKLLDEVVSQLVEQGKTTNEIKDLLGGYVNGDHGFDSSGSDFSGAANDLQNSSSQMNDALSGGMDHLDDMMSSPAMVTTLTGLAGCFDALFVGHEVTICSVSANPFELIVSIGTIAVLIPLALKLIFRKWGSGGSGGGSDD